MSDVIRTDRFQKRRNATLYSRLVDKLEADVKRIEADPWPALNEAADEIIRLREALQTISHVLCPLPEWEEGPIRPVNIEAELLERHDKALAVLRQVGF